MDKALDNDPEKSHEFLRGSERLLKAKQANPSLRLTNTFFRETILMAEEEKCGLKAPKRAFLELAQYEKRFGEAPPDKIKTITFRGKKMRGVDVIEEEDVFRLSRNFQVLKFPHFPQRSGAGHKKSLVTSN